MVVRTDAARMLVCRAGGLKDAGKPSTTETSIAKYFATEAACWCADRAIQVHGGAGYVDDHPVERFYRDVRVTTLYEGTSQIQKLIIGRAATGDQRAGAVSLRSPRETARPRRPPRRLNRARGRRNGLGRHRRRAGRAAGARWPPRPGTALLVIAGGASGRGAAPTSGDGPDRAPR